MPLPRHCVLIAVIFVSTIGSSVVAQPPDITRFRSGLALDQPQGFGLGTPANLTYGVAADGSDISPPNAQSPRDSTGNTFFPLVLRNATTADRLISSVFDRWSSISGITFVQETNDDGSSFGANPGIEGVRPDIRLGAVPIDVDGENLALAFAALPGSGSDIVFDSQDLLFFNFSPDDFRAFRNVLSHELGHAIGLSHVLSTEPFLLNPVIPPNIDGPQFHDILIVQQGYGDALERSNDGLGNDTIARATSLGEQSGNGPGALQAGETFSIGNDARELAVDLEDTDFLSIDDGTDIDIFSFSIETRSDIEITLESLGFDYLISSEFNGGTRQPFNTRERSDLALELLNFDGSNVIAESDINGLGGIESFAGILDAGDYFIRVSGDDNPDRLRVDTQFFGLTVTNTAVVPEPSSLSIALFAIVGCLATCRCKKIKQRSRS